MAESPLGAIRAKIDALDEQIQEAITQRARWVEQVARAKNNEPNPIYYRPEREADVLRRILERNQGPLPGEAMTRIFREIMSACLALEAPLRIAFLGPEGTYSQAAVHKHFGLSAGILPQPTIEEVFREVEAGNAQYGVVPVENSTEGGVNQTLDLFLRSALKICGEIELPIHHCLLSNSPDIGAVTKLYSHQQSLAQCRLWLDTKLPNVPRNAVSSNAEAARRAAEEPGAAAIASQMAAQKYGLNVLAARIEDELDNTTRFAVLGRQEVPPTGRDKTSLLLSTPNQPGALYHLLAPIAENGLSMSRVESRPSRRGMWDYVFFIDIEGHIQDAAVKQAVETMRARSLLFKLLGSYPRAVA
jgi:chorismate mutase/prephenate dehydratase